MDGRKSHCANLLPEATDSFGLMMGQSAVYRKVTNIMSSRRCLIFER